MLICTSCGRKSEGDFVFCPYCGAPLGEVAAVGERRKTVTVLFCDVAGSTALGESVDPEALRALLGRYFGRMKGIVEAHGGSVEKFIGDAVLAVFGVPVVHEDDALRAVRAAAEMREALPELGVQARIGLNTGEVVTGTAETLATGDAVNVAARLEQAAAPGEVLLGPETVRLVRDVVAVEPVYPLDLKGKSKPVAAFRLLALRVVQPERPVTTMVGRERELRRLTDAFAQAVDDHSCHLFAVLGAAGVGKSRLVAEFLAAVDARVVRGRCLSYGDGITYWPVVEVIKQLDLLPADETAAAALRALLGETDAGTSAEEIAWAFRKLLEEQAQERPLVCVFDDLHWGEETFLDLVEHVADLSRDASIFLLCMARPELLAQRPGWGGGKWNATTVLLEPLDDAEAEELLDALGGVGDDLRARIRQAAEGNPLFLQEMLALVRESGGSEVTVPPTIQALLAARLDQLEPAERAVLERGAIEGRIFHRGAVRALTPDATELDVRLMGLVRRELVRPFLAQLPGEDAFRFRHQLIRDAAYDGLSKQDRARLHEQFAAWFEPRAAGLVERDELLGYHLEQAYRYRIDLGPPDAHGHELATAAADRLAAAAMRALARDDSLAATRFFDRAVAMLPPDSPARVELLVELGLALRRAGDQQSKADAVLEEALFHAVEIGDERLKAHAEIGLTKIRAQSDPEGKALELRRLAEQAIPLFTELGDDKGLVNSWTAIANAHLFWVQVGAYEAALEQALVHARRARQPWLERSITINLALSMLWGPTTVEEGLRRCAIIIEEAPSSPVAECYCARVEAALEAMRGDFDAARRRLAQHREIVAALGFGRYGTGEAAWEVEMLAGDSVAAERAIRAEYEALLEIGDKGEGSFCAALLAEALYAQGRDSEAEKYLVVTRDLAASDDVVVQGRRSATLAKILARRGRHADGERLAREAVERFAATDALADHGYALMSLAEVLQSAQRPEEAVPVVDEARSLYERKGDIVSSGRARAVLADLKQATATLAAP